MNGEAQDIVDEAIAWHMRLDAASADDWHIFIQWLEADPAHRDAYDRIVMDDALLPARPVEVSIPIEANDAWPPMQVGRWAAAGAGIAASALFAAMLVPNVMASNRIQTACGQTRHLAPGADTAIEINGDTCLQLKPGARGYAARDSGEAVSHVHYDVTHPFEFISGRFASRDPGTVFNATREGAQLGVDVAEGSLLFQPGMQAVPLTSGMELSILDEQSQPAVRGIRTEGVWNWRQGLLGFRDTPVDAVVRAVGRSTGARIRIDDALGNRRFTGTIDLTDRLDVVIPRFAALIGADWKYGRDEWMLTTRSDE